ISTPEETEPAEEPLIPEEPQAPLVVTPAIRTEGKKSYINLSVLNDYFEDGDEVTLAILKQKNLLPARIQRVKVIGNSGLEKRLTVRAHAYSAQAQMKIVSLGGEAHIVL
ncbi:MAG: uL15 family ribosomal protein, partial [Clostridia bacterium]|nr:uL15 family ribosomal protein [Clostridia bacterium]